MLEQVALNQSRFTVPGIAPDARGIALGRSAVLSFASLDRVVSFLRVYSEEASLDEIFPTLRAHEVETSSGGRAWLLTVAAPSTYLLDRLARASGVAQGVAFTGTSKHFVKYRDTHAPLGYDATALSKTDGDFILYGESDPIAYRRKKDIAVDQLLHRLSLLADRPGTTRTDGPLWIAAAEGIADEVVGYLWRNDVALRGCRIERDGTFAGRQVVTLLRADRLPERMIRLFRDLPGVQLFAEVGENILVEHGYHHPLRLEACASLFDRARLYLFHGRIDRLDVLPVRPQLVGADHLLRTQLGPRWDTTTSEAQAREARPVTVTLRLVERTGIPPAARATLIAWTDADRLRRLVYALPGSLLDECRVAGVDAGLLVITGKTGGELPPLGARFVEAAPFLLIPATQELLPRVSPALLAERFGCGPSRWVVVRSLEEGAFAVSDGKLAPLERAVLAPLAANPVEPVVATAPIEDDVEPQVVNEDLPLFPLWGMRTKR